MNMFKEKLERGEFVLTAEIDPSFCPDKEIILRQAYSLKDCDALNSVDCPLGEVFMNSLVSSLILKEQGFEPIWHITCRDRNVLALKSELIGACALGIKNVLAVTGDRGKNPVFEVKNSIELIRLIKSMGDFFVGAAVNPNLDLVKYEIKRMKKKIKTGVDFFQTQVVYDLERFEAFLRLTKDLEPKIIVSILPLKDSKMAEEVSRIPGIRIPETMIKSLEKKTGTELACEFVDQIKDKVAGIYIIPKWDFEAAGEIIKICRL